MITEIKTQRNQQNTSYLFLGGHKIPQPDRDISRKENYWPMSLINNM